MKHNYYVNLFIAFRHCCRRPGLLNVPNNDDDDDNDDDDSDNEGDEN